MALVPDGMHPNAEGHRRWAECYTPFILRALEEADEEEEEEEEAG